MWINGSIATAVNVTDKQYVEKYEAYWLMTKFGNRDKYN
jgi:hypothetical protein